MSCQSKTNPCAAGAVLRAALLFLLISASFLLGRADGEDAEAVFSDPEGDVVLTNMNTDRGTAGDLVRAVFSASGDSASLAFGYARPPFSTGAVKLKLKLSVALFSPAGAVQESVRFVIEKGADEVSVSRPRELALESCRLERSVFTAVFRLPKGCRRIGASLESFLLWDEGESADDFPFSVLRLAAQAATPPPTPTRRVSNRVSYRPPPAKGRKDDEKAAAAAFEAARALAESSAADAWRKAEEAYRMSGDFAFKRSVLSFLLSLSPKPPPLSEAERSRTDALIAAEMIRCLRSVPVSSPQGRILLASLVNEVCERYRYPRGRMDVAALKRAYLETLKSREFPELERVRRERGARALLSYGKAALARKRYELAFRCFYDYLAWLNTGLGKGSREEAEEGLLRAAEGACAAVPSSEKKALLAMRDHRAFRELVVRPSLHFVFIGPSGALKRTPEKSFRRLDAAWLVESDLFDTSPAFRAKRIYVFLREMYGIAGGHAGGDVIAISFKFARNRPSAARVDTDLYFHELAHCLIEYAFPVRGLNEGIADLGALAAHDLLGSAAEAARRRKHALDFFRRYFTERRTPFEKIPKYAPSCGFFLRPFEGRKEPDLTWRVLRHVFCNMKKPGFAPPTPREWALWFLKLHEPWLGKAVYDRAAADGFRLPPETAALVQDEMDYYRSELAYARFQGWKALRAFARRVADENPRSYYRHLALLCALEAAAKEGEKGAAAALRDECGIPRGASLLGVFPLPRIPPQIDLPRGEGLLVEAELPSFDPFRAGRPRPEVLTPGPDGWFHVRRKVQGRRFALAASLSLTGLAGPWDGRLWISSPLPFTVWLDDTFRYHRDSEVSFAPPADPFLIPLSVPAGDHRLTLRFDSPAPDFRFRIRLTDEDGTPPSFGVGPLRSHSGPEPVSLDLETSETLFSDAFSGASSVSRWKAFGADARLKDGRLVLRQGAAPLDLNDFPKREDVRSGLGLFWLKKPVSTDQAEFAFRFRAAGGSADRRAVVVLDGEGRNEIHSGLSFHFQQDGRRITLTVMRYDGLVCCASREMPVGGGLTLVIRRFGRRFSALVNGEEILPFLGIPPVRPGKLGVAFSTGLALDSVEVRRLQRR